MNHIGLPEGWQAVRTLDLTHDRRLFLRVNLLSLAVALLAALAGIPLKGLLRASAGPGYWASCGICAAGALLYAALHEGIHGLFVRLFSGRRPEFGIGGGFAWTGRRDAYFDRRSYLIIALSPVVILGAALLALNLTLGRGWFWPVWLLQVFNLSGAAGDYLAAFVLARIPGDVLCHDTGTVMTFYRREDAAHGRSA